MLRKLTHIVLVLFLMIATTGITFSMHYCGGKLVSASVNKASKSCCDSKGGCCENKTVHFEVKDNFVSPVQIDNVKVVELDVLFPILFALRSNLYLFESETLKVFKDTSPPPTISNRLSLMQTYLC